MDSGVVGTAEARYRELETRRFVYLDRAREASKYTIPSLLPPNGHNSTTKLETPYQGVGARGVNNLASKLLLALLPPNSPFFRLRVDEFIQGQTDPGLKTEIETALSRVEQAVTTEIEVSADRVAVFEILKHLLVAGNVLMDMSQVDGMRVFHLDRYVVVRDPMGHVLEIVIHETVAPAALPEKIRQLLLGKMDEAPEKTVNLYTWVKRKGNLWTVFQEAKGIVIPGTQGTYPLERTPFIPLRGNRIDGEDYGRGYVEEYLGDLKSLEGLSRAIVEGAAAAAKVLFLVNPNGTTRAKTLAEAPNGAIREGNKEDVTVLQLEKFGDFRTAYEQIQRIEERLSFAFLLNSSIQRNAERVTAEEVRFMARELEDALGGLYSILAQEFQLPYVRRKIHQMEKGKKLPPLPKDTVKPMIITGLEALGRGHDLNKLDVFISGLTSTLGPEIVAQYLNLEGYIARRAAAIGVDTKGLIKTKEEIEAAQQQAQQQVMMAQFGPEMVRQVGGVIQKGMQNGQTSAKPSAG
ncbi:MAG: portal protein [Candidatus Melainabacteria bacterium]|nr:portal protein [Candidatus Melainabacteria bacterium]